MLCYVMICYGDGNDPSRLEKDRTGEGKASRRG